MDLGLMGLEGGLEGVDVGFEGLDCCGGCALQGLV